MKYTKWRLNDFTAHDYVGDALYIPPFWAHHVESLEQASSHGL
jgi:hypothetical protein